MDHTYLNQELTFKFSTDRKYRTKLLKRNKVLKFCIIGDYTNEQIKHFKYAHSVHIEKCNYITDLSPFLNYMRVDIIRCSGISNISLVETIFLGGLENVVDVSFRYH